MKRLIALVVVCVISFGISIRAFAENVFSDMDLVTFKGDNHFILPGEFYENILKVLDISIESNVEPVFEDLLPGDAYYDVLMTAYKNGYIKGIGNRLNPNTPIIYYDILRVIVNALGYEEYAQIYGGYPFGYMSIAAKIGLLDGISIYGDDWVEKENLIKIWENAVEIPVMDYDIVNSGVNFDVFVKEENADTLLSKYRDVYMEEGIVTAVGQARINKAVRAMEQYITIDDKSFYVDEDMDFSEFLGCRVKYYYIFTDNVEKVVSMKKVNSCEIIETELFNVYDADSSNVYYYNEKGKEKKARLGKDTVIVYNYEPAEKYDKTLFLEGNGTVRFIDNNGDGLYDGIIVKSYRNVFVKSVNIYSNIIYDNYGNDLQLTKEETELLYNRKGEALEMREIQPNNIVSYLKDDLGNIKELIVLSGGLSGTINDFVDDGNYLKLTINHEEYFISREVEENYLGFKTGENISVYFDILGYVAGYTSDSSSEFIFGYIRRGYTDENEDVYLKIFTQNNETATYAVNDKVKIDGNNIDKIMIEDYLQDKGGLIRFKLNGEGLINKIDTSFVSENEDARNSLCTIFDKTRIRYRTAGSFTNQLLIDSSVLIFSVPERADGSNDSDYKIISPSGFMADTEYTVEGFAINEDDICPGVIVKYGSGAEMPSNQGISVISGIKTALSQDDEETLELELNNETGMNVYNLKNMSVAEELNLKVGDCIRYSIDSYNEINKIEYVYSVENGMNQNDAMFHKNSGIANSAINTHAQFALINASIYAKNGSNILIAKEDDIKSAAAEERKISLNETAAYNLSDCKIYIYDKTKKKKVYEGGTADLNDARVAGKGDNIILYTKYSKAVMLYVIRNEIGE